jgi:myo-inositol-1-phosphate synthase
MSLHDPRAINIAIVGVGNCASSLVQGLAHYQNGGANDQIGLMHWDLGGYRPKDIRIVAAWDIDRRKVGQDVAGAIFEKPNCTAIFCDHVPPSKVEVEMGRILDGVSEHMADWPDDRTFLPADLPQPEKADVVRRLKETETDVLFNYLPVGSQEATEFYAECALEAGVAFVNNIPVFIASDPPGRSASARPGCRSSATTSRRSSARRSSTASSPTCSRSAASSSSGPTSSTPAAIPTSSTCSNRKRLASKKISKTEAVQSVAERRLDDENIHVGPSDYVAWQNDNKVCFLRMEGSLFGGVPMNLELRLSVEDSPNSAGVAIDMIRCAKIAKDRGLAGPVHPAAAYFCKHPPDLADEDRVGAVGEVLDPPAQYRRLGVGEAGRTVAIDLPAGGEAQIPPAPVREDLGDLLLAPVEDVDAEMRHVLERAVQRGGTVDADEQARRIERQRGHGGGGDPHRLAADADGDDVDGRGDAAHRLLEVMGEGAHGHAAKQWRFGRRVTIA